MAYSLFSCGSSDESYDHHQQSHFLESCSMCQKPLGLNRDIFMYRGITAYCSEDCRQEQIEIDESKERSWNLSASMRALRKTTPATSKPTSVVTTATANSAVAGVVRVA